MDKGFAQLVKSMRAAQKRYFRTRTIGDLELAKELEHEVDVAVEGIFREPDLFDKEIIGAPAS